MKKLSNQTTATAFALLFGVSFGTWALLSEESHTQVKNDPVFSREVVAYEFLPSADNEESVVKYEYLGKPLPEKLAPDEDVAKRTETSYTRITGVANAGTDREKSIYTGTFFTRPTFTQDEGRWYYIEHATTTESAFNRAREENAFAALFWRKAYAATISPFAGAGDGEVRNLGGDGGAGDPDWVVYCVDGGGTHVSATATTAIVLSQDKEQTLGEDVTYICNIRRVFLPFDTSSIPAGSSVSAATLNVYVTSKTNNLDDGVDYITVVQTSQATHTTLATSDFPSVGSTHGVSSPTDIGSITTSAYNTFTLNSTGRGFIKFSGVDAPCSATNGITCIGLREGHDMNGVALGSLNLQDSITISTSENTGTSQDPYMNITYTTGSFAFWQFQDY